MAMNVVSEFDATAWTPTRVVDAKRGRTISLCFPCRNEATTIGELVATAYAELVERSPVLDELIVLDDRSTDDTARVAADAGAVVVPISEIHDRHGVGHGKGNALWASLVASSGDIVVWCDGDVTSFNANWVTRLAAPLLVDDAVGLVKPSYRRPTDEGGGGRTTELLARPVLRVLAPELATLTQPLAGEYAVRRSVIEQLPIVQGWGAEIAMVLDVARGGPGSIAQVELDERRHRHHPLEHLASQATEVLAAALDRLGLVPTGSRTDEWRPHDRPPIATLRDRPPPVPRRQPRQHGD